jgi:hypothetical protein
MTPRQEFKQCLIKGWLTHRVWQCAAMVMIDHNIKYENENGTPNMAIIQNFLRTVQVPLYPDLSVSVYIAAFYPATSASLFLNNSTSLHIFWKEQQRAADYSKSLGYERKYEKLKNKQIKFISLRSLSKKHDWKTVK